MKKIEITKDKLEELLFLATKWEDFSAGEESTKLPVSTAKKLAVQRIIQQKLNL